MGKLFLDLEVKSRGRLALAALVRAWLVVDSCLRPASFAGHADARIGKARFPSSKRDLSKNGRIAGRHPETEVEVDVSDK